MSGVFRKRIGWGLAGIVIAVALAFTPMAYRTWLWAADSHGLATIALLKDEQVPLNPFDHNSLLLQPDQALWVLETFDWPYGRCAGITLKMDWCSQPLVSMVGASLDLEAGQQRERALALLRFLIERGEPLNERHHGLAPVHDAVLFADEGYLQLLLASGADLSVRIDQPDKSFHQFDALQFARFLESREPEKFAGVVRVLDQFSAVSAEGGSGS